MSKWIDATAAIIFGALAVLSMVLSLLTTGAESDVHYATSLGAMALAWHFFRDARDRP